MILNPDKEHVKAIKESLKDTRNNCPCILPPYWNIDTQCPCKEMREDNVCHCGLYINEE